MQLQQLKIVVVPLPKRFPMGYILNGNSSLALVNRNLVKRHQNVHKDFHQVRKRANRGRQPRGISINNLLWTINSDKCSKMIPLNDKNSLIMAALISIIQAISLSKKISTRSSSISKFHQDLQSVKIIKTKQRISTTALKVTGGGQEIFIRQFSLIRYKLLRPTVIVFLIQISFKVTDMHPKSDTIQLKHRQHLRLKYSNIHHP